MILCIFILSRIKFRLKQINPPTISEDGQYSHSPRPRSVDRKKKPQKYIFAVFGHSVCLCLSVCLSIPLLSWPLSLCSPVCLSECPVHPSSPQSLSLNTIMSVCLSIPLLSRSLSFRRPVCLIVSMYLNVLCERVFCVFFLVFFFLRFFFVFFFLFLFLFNLLS